MEPNFEPDTNTTHDLTPETTTDLQSKSSDVVMIVLSREAPNLLGKRVTNGSLIAITLATALTSIGFVVVDRYVYVLLAIVVGTGWTLLPRRWSEANNICFASIVLLSAAAGAMRAPSLLCILTSCIALAAWDLVFFAGRIQAASTVINYAQIWRTHMTTLTVSLLLGLVAAIASTVIKTQISWPKIALLALGGLWLVLRVDGNKRQRNR